MVARYSAVVRKSGKRGVIHGFCTRSGSQGHLQAASRSGSSVIVRERGGPILNYSIKSVVDRVISKIFQKLPLLWVRS